MAADNVISLLLSLKGAQAVEAGIQRLSTGFKELAALGGVTLSLGAFTTALVEGTKHAIDSADEFGKLAQKVGLASDALSGLSYAAKLSDATQDDLRLGMKEFADVLGKAGQGSADLFAEFLKVSDQFAAAPDGIDKTNKAIELFGRAGQSLVPLLNQGSDAITKQIEEAKRMGLVVGPDFAARAEVFNDNLTRIKAEVTGLFLQLADRLLPALIQFSNWILEFNQNGAQTKQLVNGISTAFEGLGNTLLTINAAIQAPVSFWTTLFETKNVKPAFEEWKNVWTQYQHKIVELDRAINEPPAVNLGSINRNVPLQTLRNRTKDYDDLLEASRRKLEILKLIDQNEAASPWITQEEKRQRRIASLLAQSAELTARKAQLDKMAADMSLPEEQRTRAANQSFDTSANIAGNENEANRLEQMQTLTGTMSAAITQLEDRMGTLQQNIATGFTEVIGTAINSVSEHITRLIEGTETWNQALAGIGQTILHTIIQAIVKMFVTWIANLLILRALKAIFHSSENTEAVQAAAAWAPAAVAASIASYGTAAAVGTASAIAGMAIGSAAAAGLASSGFYSGGYTGNGDPHDVAGVVHNREFVFDHQTVQRIGVGNLEAMRAGAAGIDSKGMNIILGVHGDVTGAKTWLDSKEGERYILDIVGKRAYEFRG